MDARMLRFENFEVDLRARELRRGSSVVRLQEQPFQILAMMLERPGDIVTREEIRARLWPDGTTVDFEHSVNAAVKRLRAALGDAAEHPRYVETLPRRGYRFIARIQDPDPASTAPNRAPAAPHRPRLVVLPFANLSDDPAQDYFSDGLTEEMIAQLGRRCASRIGVLARTSSMLYKNAMRGAGDIGEALRADYLVEGSVRREGDRVRITAQLIETSGETHVWAESYDRRLADCLAVQMEVASEIAHALSHELLPTSNVETAGTRHTGAYQAYLKGRYCWNKAGDTGLREAVAYYDQALRLDPVFGRAHSARARAYLSLADYYIVEPREALQTARTSAEHALEIDPYDAEAYIAVAEARRVLDWDWPGATSAYRRALAAHPNSEAALRYYAVFVATRGRSADALAAADRACEIDPLCLVVNTSAATVRYFGRDYEAALARCRDVADMDQAFVPGRRVAAASLVQLGRCDEAIAQLASLADARLDPVSLAWMGQALAAGGNLGRARDVLGQLQRMEETRFVSAYHVALLHAALGDAVAAFAMLGHACEARDPWLDTLAVEPRMAPLRGDSRFRTLVDRLGLEFVS
jgi:TolB-like protein/tetratricopeptide (TPR) repeat protein